MAHFEKTALYERMTDFIDIMDEDELRELTEICKVKADILEQARIERRRAELEDELRSLIHTIQEEGFRISIDNRTNPNYILDLETNDVYCAEVYK